MGLFDRKKTTYENSSPLYTLGNSKTLLVVGLGNPGKEYAANRHNLGFMAVDRYHASHEFSGWTAKNDLKCMLATGQIGSTRVLLVKPSTFMNNSGEALQAVHNFYKISNADTLVVYDELYVEFATIRVRSGGGSAGHNGIKSLIQHAGEDFGRLRLGIGPKKPARMATADFVLQDFSTEQQEIIPKILREACSIIDERTVGPVEDITLSL